MWLHRFVAGQLRRPTGRFGRAVMTRLLNHGNAELIEATLARLHVHGTDRLLDVGFGGGGALMRAAARTRGHLYGVDFSPDVIAQGQRRLKNLVAQGRLTLLVADVTDLPLRDALVDKVVTTNTVYFWPDMVAGFRSIRRVMAAGGEISVGFSGKAKMEEFGAVTDHGFEKPDAEEVLAAVERAGLLDARAHVLGGRRTQGDFVVTAKKGDA